MFQIQLLLPKRTRCQAIEAMGCIGWELTHTNKQIDDNQRNIKALCLGTNSINTDTVHVLYKVEVIIVKSNSGPKSTTKCQYVNVDVLLSVFLQPQSTDFTQYNSYGDMCGGGRGESCNQNEASKQISYQFHQCYSASVLCSLRVHKWTCILEYLHNDSHSVTSGTAVL